MLTAAATDDDPNRDTVCWWCGEEMTLPVDAHAHFCEATVIA